MSKQVRSGLLQGIGVKFLKENEARASYAWDWGFWPYRDALNIESVERHPVLARMFPAPQKYRHVKKPERLRTGDHLTIFKTIGAGHVRWQGTIDLVFTEFCDIQRGFSEQEWVALFLANLPAKLERSGSHKQGYLFEWVETGMEAPAWAIHEFSNRGIQGLDVVENGDTLTIYDDVHDGEIEWQGTLEFGADELLSVRLEEFDKEEHIFRKVYHMDLEAWLGFTMEHRPVLVAPR